MKVRVVKPPSTADLLDQIARGRLQLHMPSSTQRELGGYTEALDRDNQRTRSKGDAPKA